MPRRMTKPKIGRPPKPESERGRKVLLYLSAEALAALEALAKDGERSALVSRLLVEERRRVGG